MKWLLTYILSMFFSMITVSQVRENIDAIYKTHIKPEKEADKKIARILDFIDTSKNPLHAHELIHLLLQDAKASKDDYVTTNAYNLLGKMYRIRHLGDSAVWAYHRSLKISGKKNYKRLQFDSYLGLMSAHTAKSRFDSARFYIEQADKKSAFISDLNVLARYENRKGNVFLEQEKYFEAVQCYLKIDSIFPNKNIDVRGYAFLNLGTIYEALSDHKKASIYYLKALEIFSELKSIRNINFLKLKLGHSQLYQKSYANAIHYYQEILPYYKVSYPRFYGVTTTSLGAAHLYLKNFDIAQKCLEESRNVLESHNDSLFLIETYTYLSMLHTQKKDKENAVLFGEKANMIAEKTGSKGKRKRRALVALSEALYLNEEYKQGFEAIKELQKIDEAFDLKKNRISLLEWEHEEEQKKKQLALLSSQKQLAEQKNKNQRNLFVSGLSILALTVIGLFILFKNKQKTNKKLKELEKAKSKFFTNISHEFRTPLTLISGPVAHQLSKKKLSREDKTDLGLIQRNANRLLELVDQLLDLSKIEAGRRQLSVSKGNINLFLKHITEPFQYQAHQKDISFTNTIHVPSEAWFDPDVLQKIVTNLLSNAVKYTPKNGFIDVVAETLNGNIKICIANQNNSITEKELPLLFDRFYQNNSYTEGFGIGLALVKDLTHLTHGTLTTKKPNTNSIQFEVIIPITTSAFSSNELVDQQIPENAYTKQLIHSTDNQMDWEEKEHTEDLPILLVVDDNEEIRLFIKLLFRKNYTIIEAENGSEGVAIALENIPDLVISDIMMPVKDGIYLSNTLKSNLRTSHIPIILLTAKSGEEQELTGFKTGADAYITKPFKEEKLRVVIEKLIASRKAIQEKFSQQSILKPQEVTLTSPDTKLLERIQVILDNHLTDPEFTPSVFSGQIGLSRMHLHRKLKALTGLSTSEFISSQRLKLAARLLTEANINISEVGYTVGFSQPAYFSQCFKKHYGYSPSEYLKRNSSSEKPTISF